MPTVPVRIVRPGESGCGCLIGIVVALAAVGLAIWAGWTGVVNLGAHVYRHFHHGAVIITGYNNSTGHFYGSVGLAVVFGGAAILAIIVALFSRSKGAGVTAVSLLFLAVAAGIAAEILH
jgi:hypothetical protein